MSVQRRTRRRAVVQDENICPNQKGTNAAGNKRPILSDRTNIPRPINGVQVPRKEIPLLPAKRRLNEVEHNQGKNEPIEEMEVDSEIKKQHFQWLLDVSDLVEERNDEDCDKVIYVTNYVRSIYKYLRFYEEQFHLRSDFMTKHKDMTPRMRYILVDWLSKIHSRFELTLESFHLAVKILDRYIDVAETVNKSNLQLIGTTALLIASKIEEIYPPAISDLSFMTENSVTPKEIRNTEMDMLKILDFRVNIPTPLQFYRRLSHISNFNSLQHCMGKYLIELCLMEPALCHHRPSMLAAASVWLVRLMMYAEHTPWTQTLQSHTKFSESDLLPIASLLASNILRHNQPSKYRAIRDKYASLANHHVSTLPCTSSESVIRIAYYS